MPAPYPLSEASDRTLASRAADGDIAAFEALVHRHGPIMRVLATKILGSEYESDDVVQDVFIRAWAQFDHLTDPASVRPWLMRMVTNRSIERIRKRKDQLDIADREILASAGQDPQHLVEVDMQISALSLALQHLPEAQRQCWVLKEVGGISYSEIAEELDLPISTVRGQLARARRNLIQEMGEWR